MRIEPDKLPLPREPYRGVLPYRLLDWRIFFERERETERLGNLVSMYAGVLLYGKSGTGKSSLLNAGLVPEALGRGRAPERIRVFRDPDQALLIERIHLREEDQQSPLGPEAPVFLPSRFTSEDNDERIALSCEKFLQLLRAPSELGIPLLIFDQFEEYVTLFEETSTDREAFESAQKAHGEIEALLRELLLNDPLPLKIVFAFRDDYFAQLVPFFARIPGLMDQGVRMSLPGVEAVEQIVRGPFVPPPERGLPAGHFRSAQGQPDELSQPLARKLVEGMRAARPSGLANLSEVQVLCSTLWHRPETRDELLGADDPAAVLQKILVSAAMGNLKDFSPLDKVRARVLLSNLVTEDGTRDVVSEEKLISETRSKPSMWFVRGDLRKVLKQLLRDTHLLRQSKTGDNIYYELASEFLISWIQKQQKRFRKQASIVWSALFAALSLLVVTLFILAVWVNAEKNKAVVAKKAAVELINFMQYELSDNLSKVGHFKMMGVVNARIRQYHEDHPPEADDLAALRERSVSLDQYGDLQITQGDLAGALKSYRDGLAISEKLSKKDSGNVDWQRDLFVSYNKVGDVQIAQGDIADALKSYRDGLALSEKLSKKDPGEADRERDLSVSYHRVGDGQRAQGDLPGALKSYRDSFVIHEKLSRQEPGNTSWQRDLSVSYEKVGDVQRDQDDLAGALKSYRESLVIREKLITEEPGNPSWQRDLSVSYEKVGDVQRDQGDLAGALESYRNSFVIRERLARQDPDNTGWQRDLSVGYEKVGDVQSDQGDLAGALESYRECFVIREKLSKHDLGNDGWQRDLSVSYNKVGDVQRAQNDLAGALKTYHGGLAIAEKLAQQDPGNTGWQRDLSVSYKKVGDVQRDQGDLAGALKSYRESFVIREKLSKQDPGNTGWQRDLSVSYERVGDVQRDQGDLAGALENYRKALAIAEKLTQQEPGNASWQRDLSVSYERVGDVQRDQGDLAGALKSYRDSLLIRERLSRQDPGNDGWQRDLSVSYNKVGDVQGDQGDLAGALKSYRDSLAIREKLSTQSPGNAGWQSDLAFSYWRTGTTLARSEPQSKLEARRMVEKGRDILRELKTRTGLTALQQQWLESIEASLLEMEKEK